MMERIALTFSLGWREDCIYAPRGRPRPRVAIMFFCISLVPPAILTPMLSRYICLIPPSSAAYLESAANWPVRPMTCIPISLNRLSMPVL